MAIIISGQDKKQQYLILILIVLLAAIIFVIWYGFFSGPPEAAQEPLFQKKEIKINWEVLDNLSKDIESVEEIPSFEGQPGRQNPFTPY